MEKENRARFTLGIIFSSDGQNIYLMRKDHPAFQAGKLSGVGGKLEPGESWQDCMAREGMEEAGYEGQWQRLGTMAGDTPCWGLYHCEVFYSFMAENAVEPHTCEREAIERHTVTELPALATQMTPYLPTLIMAALAHHAAAPDRHFSLSISE